MYSNNLTLQPSLVAHGHADYADHPDIGSPARVSRVVASPVRNRFRARGAQHSPIRYSGSPERRRTIAELELDNKRPLSSLAGSLPKKLKSVTFLDIPNLEYHDPSPIASRPLPPRYDLPTALESNKGPVMESILSRLDTIERTQQLILLRLSERNDAETEVYQQLHLSIDSMRLQIEKMAKGKV